MKFLCAFILSCFGASLSAETVVPTRTIRAHELINPADLKLRPIDVAGSFSKIEAVSGLEARVALYPGRPVKRSDVGPPAIVQRNQLIPLVYKQAGLVIRTEGRVLDRAGVGDWVRVMNMSSRATVMGRVQADGSVSVSQ